MTLNELVEAIQKILPDSFVDEDLNGELLICTGMAVDENNNLHKFNLLEETEDKADEKEDDYGIPI